jgi:hypothetical protein
MASGNHYQTTHEVTFTTTGNIDNLDTQGASLIRMNNASLATIRGLKADAGQEVTIVSIGAGIVEFAHQNANSTAENRLLNMVTSSTTRLAAGSGAATYRYDKATGRWRLIAHNQGAYIATTFAAGDYTGNGLMTFTVASGDVITNTSCLVGKLLFFTVRVFTTSVGGTPSDQLHVAIPNGYTAVASVLFPARLSDNGGASTFGHVRCSAAGATCFVSKLDSSNWTAAANTTAFDFSVIIEVT